MSADRGELAAAVSALLAAAGVEPSELAGLLGDMAGSGTELPTVDEAVASMVETNRYAKGTFRSYRTGWLLRPLLVAPVMDRSDVERMKAYAGRVTDQLVEGRFDPSTVPDGHPPQLCQAMYCSVRLAATASATR